jgi:hypothetical protein
MAYRTERSPMEAEVVHPRDGDAVTLRPCPPWCTAARHFADGQAIDADDGHPLGAGPGPAFIELNIGTPTERTDMCAEITPAEARAVGRALLDLAAMAERDGPWQPR